MMLTSCSGVESGGGLGMLHLRPGDASRSADIVIDITLIAPERFEGMEARDAQSRGYIAE